MTGDSNIRVRDFRADDVKALIDVFRSSVRIIARRDYTQAQVIAWAPDVIDSGVWETRYATRRAFVAEIDSTQVGFTDLESDGHVDMMYVHAQCQGKGIASALLSHVESVARGLGIHELHTESSITARWFFERRGFQLISQQIVSMRGQKFVNYRMKKLLNTRAYCEATSDEPSNRKRRSSG
jgi:putative acetyltransferase